MAPLCAAAARPGKPSEAAQVLTEQLSGVLQGAVDRRQLCIDPGKAAWAVYVDVYVLDAGGGRGCWGLGLVELPWPGVPAAAACPVAPAARMPPACMHAPAVT